MGRKKGPILLLTYLLENLPKTAVWQGFNVPIPFLPPNLNSGTFVFLL